MVFRVYVEKKPGFDVEAQQLAGELRTILGLTRSAHLFLGFTIFAGLTVAEHVHDELPLLIFLQGGPGGCGPRPLNPQSDGWIEEAIRHFRVVLPDQRGTGRSSRIDTHIMKTMDGEAGAAFLKHFLADSIIRDFEHLRRPDRKSTRLNSSHSRASRMPSSA